MTQPPDTPWLRFRVYVAGRLQEETWVDVRTPPAELAEIQTRHVKHVIAAQVLGLKWLVEVYDPDLPDDHAYARYGTDLQAMRNPIEVPRQTDGTPDIAALIVGGPMRKPGGTITGKYGRPVNVDDAFANLAEQYDAAPITNLPLPEPEAGQ